MIIRSLQCRSYESSAKEQCVFEERRGLLAAFQCCLLLFLKSELNVKKSQHCEVKHFATETAIHVTLYKSD